MIQPAQSIQKLPLCLFKEINQKKQGIEAHIIDLRVDDPREGYIRPALAQDECPLFGAAETMKDIRL